MDVVGDNNDELNSEAEEEEEIEFEKRDVDLNYQRRPQIK